MQNTRKTIANKQHKHAKAKTRTFLIIFVLLFFVAFFVTFFLHRFSGQTRYFFRILIDFFAFQRFPS